MKISPTKDYVLVLREESEIEKNGIFIPESAQEPQRKGYVQAIGREVKEVAVGDKVMFIWSAGFDIKSDGVEYNTLLLMKESDILAILTEDTK